MEDWLRAAKLIKAKTNEGGLSAIAAEGLSFLLREGTEVAFVPPRLRTPRRAKVSRVQKETDSTYLVFFEGITTREAAAKLKGAYCLVRSDDVSASSDVVKAFTLQGFSLVDETRGLIGHVVGIEENPAHAMLRVAVCGQSEKQERLALVPFVEEFIVKVNRDAKTLLMRLPEGLLEL